MSRAQAVEAVGQGIRLVQEQKKAGVGLLATGEMGIGNTTTSSAVAAVLLGQPVERMTGRGAGLSDTGLARKVDAIHRGIVRNHPDPADPLDVMAKLGGFDIAGLCGIFLGGALKGFLCWPTASSAEWRHSAPSGSARRRKKAVFASHCSTEPAAKLVLDALNKKPSSRQASIWARAPGRWPPSRCGIWRWPLRWLLFLRRGRHRCLHAAGEARDADAGRRRRSQRKERLRRVVLVLKTGLPRYYLATMQVWDAECAARVEKHRKMRAEKQFETLECPLHLDHLALPGRGTVLLEDLGNLVANELYDPGGAGEHTAKAVLTGLECLAAGCSNLIVVSNEVFSGGQTMQAIRAVSAGAGAGKQRLRRPGGQRLPGGLRPAGVLQGGREAVTILQTIAVAFAMFSALPVPQFGWNEKNMRYAMCAFPPHRAGVRRAVVPLRRPALAGHGPGGGVLPRAGGCHRRHPSGRLCRHLRCPLELRRPRKKSSRF